MWISEETVHVFRGKGYPHRCDLCGWQISVGQVYRRHVERQGSKRLFVHVEHEDERDCLWEEEELIRQGLSVEAKVPVLIEMVVTSRVVAKIALNGETVYETELFTEMRAVEDIETSQEENFKFMSDSDDEIPF